MIDLNSRINGVVIDWHMFMGPPNLEYPTYSPSIKHDFVLLNPNSQTFINFAVEHRSILSKRGIFQTRQYCSEKLTLNESVACYKKCYLSNLNVKT